MYIFNSTVSSRNCTLQQLLWFALRYHPSSKEMIAWRVKPRKRQTQSVDLGDEIDVSLTKNIS